MKKIYMIMLSAIVSVSSFATTFTVNDLGTGSSGAGTMGTLEYCIEQANLTAGPHTIEFSIAGTISITANADYLPDLDSDEIIIDGTSAPGYVDEPVIIIDHSGTTSGHGLTINGLSCEIYALEIKSAGFNGINITASSGDNTIESCVIRDSGYDGISIVTAGSNFLIENRIGVTADGTTCAPNGYNGIDINSNSGGNELIDNHIACNGYDGINLDNAHNNIIQGNTIGPLEGNCTSNGYNGIDVRGGSSSNIIGGTVFGEANKIAGNLYWGIRVHETGTVGNVISGNSISCNDYDGIEIAAPANGGIAAPVISSADGTTITGTSVANATIEVFRSHDPTIFNCPGTPLNQGADYLGTTTADGTGNWSLTGTFDGYVVATQTNIMNSSEFSNEVNTGITASWTNGCEGEVVYPIVPPSADFTMSSDSICVGDCVDFQDTSTDNPDTWDWSFTGAETTTSSNQNPTGICYNTSGVYQVILTASNGGGSDFIQYDLTVLDLPVATITQNGSTLNATSGFSSYEWLLDGVTVPGATDDSLIVTVNGDYEVVVTDANGCSDTSAVLTVGGLTIDNPVSQLYLNIYPNPSSGLFTLNFHNLPESDVTVLVIDQLGRVLINQNVTNTIFNIDLSNYAEGTYFVKVQTNGWEKVKRVQLIK